MEYETKLRIEINDLLSKYNYEHNSIERQRIEQLIEDFKAKNIEISYAINFLEEKIKVRINKKEIDNLKSIDFFKYAEITLGRKLENEEILEMVSSFNITPKELNESISLINNNKFSELQDLINKNIIIADGFVFCKKRNLIRLNNFIAYDIKKNNTTIYVSF